MKTYQIDNTLAQDDDRAVLWQYEHCENLKRVFEVFRTFFVDTVETFWNGWLRHLSIGSLDESGLMTADDYGLAVWGKILHVTRPTLTYEATVEGVTTTVTLPMNGELYRRFLVAKLRLFERRATVPDYVDCVNLIFGENNVFVNDTEDMGLSFELADGNTLTNEERAAFERFDEILDFYPTGVRDNVRHTGPVLGTIEQSVYAPGYEEKTIVEVLVYGTPGTVIPGGSKFTVSRDGASTDYVTASGSDVPQVEIGDEIFPGRDGCVTVVFSKVKATGDVLPKGSRLVEVTSAGAPIPGVHRAVVTIAPFGNIKTSNFTPPEGCCFVKVKATFSVDTLVQSGSYFEFGGDRWLLGYDVNCAAGSAAVCFFSCVKPLSANPIPDSTEVTLKKPDGTAYASVTSTKTSGASSDGKKPKTVLAWW